MIVFNLQRQSNCIYITIQMKEKNMRQSEEMINVILINKMITQILSVHLKRM